MQIYSLDRDPLPTLLAEDPRLVDAVVVTAVAAGLLPGGIRLSGPLILVELIVVNSLYVKYVARRGIPRSGAGIAWMKAIRMIHHRRLLHPLHPTRLIQTGI
jgi:hypothetical protein